MDRKIMLLKIWTEDESYGDGGMWRDLYFDVNKISGWFLPDDKYNFGKALNILFEGDMITVKQEPHIVDFLTKHFVEPSREVEI